MDMMASDLTTPLRDRLAALLAARGRSEQYKNLADDVKVLRNPEGLIYVCAYSDLVMFKYHLSSALVEVQALARGLVTSTHGMDFFTNAINVGKRIEVHLMPTGYSQDWTRDEAVRATTPDARLAWMQITSIAHYPPDCPVRWMTSDVISTYDGAPVKVVWRGGETWDRPTRPRKIP